MSLLWPCGCYLHWVLVERDPMARDMMLPVGMLHAPLVVNYLHNLVRVTVLFISLDYFFPCACVLLVLNLHVKIFGCVFFLVIKTFSCWGACCWNTVLQRFRNRGYCFYFCSTLLHWILCFRSVCIGCKTNSSAWSNGWASLCCSSFPEYLAMFMDRPLSLCWHNRAHACFSTVFTRPTRKWTCSDENMFYPLHPLECKPSRIKRLHKNASENLCSPAPIILNSWGLLLNILPGLVHINLPESTGFLFDHDSKLATNIVYHINDTDNHQYRPICTEIYITEDHLDTQFLIRAKT